jgi:hypothetical protein
LRKFVVPYDADYMYPGKHPEYRGASSDNSDTKLPDRKGYRLVGANIYGFNTIYVLRGLVEDLIPEIAVAAVLAHPRNVAREKVFEAIKDWPTKKAEPEPFKGWLASLSTGPRSTTVDALTYGKGSAPSFARSCTG